MIGARHRAREVALAALYSHDLQADKDREVTELTLAGAEVPAEVRDFARELVDGVLRRLREIDDLIAAAAENWDLSRLAVVDRNILRLAIYEMLEREDVPTKVSINEAIELGKRFSTAQSGAFVNGILDRIRRDLGLPIEDRPDEQAEKAPGGREEWC